MAGVLEKQIGNNLLHFYMAYEWLILCMLSIFHDFLLPAYFFSNLTFSKYIFRNTIRVSNGIDPDQAQLSVGTDLGPNCLPRLSTNNKYRCWQAELRKQIHVFNDLRQLFYSEPVISFALIFYSFLLKVIC